MRTIRFRILTAAAAGGCALLLSACGPSGSPTPSPTTGSPSASATSTAPTSSASAPETSPTSPAQAAGDASLDIKVLPSADAQPINYKLECRSGAAAPGSTVPDPARACAAALKNVAAFTDKPDVGKACSMIYSGPETATVTGTINGKNVRGSFGRSDGCKEATWQSLAPLFGMTASGAQ